MSLLFVLLGKDNVVVFFSGIYPGWLCEYETIEHRQQLGL